MAAAARLGTMGMLGGGNECPKNARGHLGEAALPVLHGVEQALGPLEGHERRRRRVLGVRAAQLHEALKVDGVPHLLELRDQRAFAWYAPWLLKRAERQEQALDSHRRLLSLPEIHNEAHSNP